MIDCMHSFVHDQHTSVSIEETFLLDFLVILKEMFPQYYIHSYMHSMLEGVSVFLYSYTPVTLQTTEHISDKCFRVDYISPWIRETC